ncbi:hypothetical conserved protein [Candidatus Nitrosoglobus terrae]|uniref:Hypothetical conserved protein n=1 Tax=Candidatus Nitrosoglobus terrae TaxID=1630141 RepID=A0A1Q2SP85_9GAMM|nr:PEP-CTERM sorting domain-containing protein [Candidatus Nitrosoglobus terrae]BAW80975.1 hypothetical conserved protein [Candidatus Nitrosoglobus terrae]
MKFLYLESLKGASKIGPYFKALLCTGLILIGVITTSSAWAVPSYRVIELSPSVPGFTGVSGINNNNQLLINAEQAGFDVFVSSYTNLNNGDFLTSSPVSPGDGDYFGNDLNNNGQVAGSAFTSPGNSFGGSAAVFSGGTGLAVGLDNNGIYQTYAINNDGFVTDPSTGQPVSPDQITVTGGEFYGISNNNQAIGQIGNDAVIFNFNTDKGINLGAGTGYAVNDNGQATGSFGFYNPTTGKITSLGGTGYAINNSGQAVGSFGLYNPSTGQIISLGGTGYGINDSGEIVGQSSSGGAFLDDQGAQYNLYNLLTPASKTMFSSLNQATGINNQGWILGTGATNNGSVDVPFLAIPTTASVPLPSSLALLSLGLGLLGIIGRRQTRREG